MTPVRNVQSTDPVQFVVRRSVDVEKMYWILFNQFDQNRGVWLRFSELCGQRPDNDPGGGIVTGGVDEQTRLIESHMSEERYLFKASRWTKGNLWFPLRIEVTPQRVSRIKPRLVGSNEESISISQVASVSIETGLIWSTIQIDSTGGTDPIVSRGHRKADAIQIRDLIERFQHGLPNSR